MGTKRRRERDRPKAAPNAAYNPNKRVLLSYASDDDEDLVEDHLGTGCPEALQAVTDNYQIEEYPDDEETNVVDTEAGAEPPRVTPLDERSHRGGYEKKSLANSGSQFGQGGRRDYTTGQFPALGSLVSDLDDVDHEDGESGSGNEALAYLQAVRSERETLPAVFRIVEHPTDRDADAEDERGYLDDDAYVARPSLGPTVPEEMRTTIDAQEAFTQSLKEQFLAQRKVLNTGGDGASGAKLDQKHPITFPGNGGKAQTEWIRILRTTTPVPAQLSQMSQAVVFKLLALMEKHCLVREEDITPSISTWIWSLLSRLDDVATMDNDTVYLVRTFGKRAILVQLSFQNPAAAEQLELADENNDAGDGDMHSLNGMSIGDVLRQDPLLAHHEDVSSSSVGEVPTRDQSQSCAAPEAARQNTMATLDMILVIVGDVFGQRDLLEFRETWTTETADKEATPPT